ncbi:MAG: hypothetical protein H6726_17605 [Sandaracinaceae bacterium]|nr:hypothetical protein [Sandaracinaceae bacterium]
MAADTATPSELAPNGVFARATDIPAPRLPSPVADAQPACGAMGRRPLGAELPLLGDRLYIRPLEGAYAQPRAWNIMGAPEPERSETRLYFEEGEDKLVVMSYELFATAGPDVVTRVQEEAARAFPGDDLERMDVLGDGVEALRLVPRVLDTSSEAVRVLTLFVIGRDRSLQVLSFYVNPAAAQTSGDARRDHDACVELALRSARTLRAGGRSLATGATETLEAGTRHLQVTLPPQGTLLTQPGPDFVVYRLFDLLPFGAPRVTGFVYFGGHPMNIRTSTDIIEQDVFGAPARFYAIALEDGATRLDLMEDVGHGYYAHVQLTVPAGASAASWLAALRDARFVP